MIVKMPKRHYLVIIPIFEYTRLLNYLIVNSISLRRYMAGKKITIIQIIHSQKMAIRTTLIHYSSLFFFRSLSLFHLLPLSSLSHLLYLSSSPSLNPFSFSLSRLPLFPPPFSNKQWNAPNSK